MVARRLLVAAVFVAVALVPTGVSASLSTASRAMTVYRLRSDARLCPSPLCGGFWATRVNQITTTCLGGIARPACYVASIDLSALAPAVQARVRPALASGRALVTGVFARYSIDEFPQLATLVAARVWLAAGPNRDAGTVYRIVDTGLRCIRAPCFSLRATVVNGTRALTLSSLDLAGTGASATAIGRAHAALAHGGVLAAGTIRAAAKTGTPEAGRALAATQVWLPA